MTSLIGYTEIEWKLSDPCFVSCVLLMFRIYMGLDTYHSIHYLSILCVGIYVICNMYASVCSIGLVGLTLYLLGMYCVVNCVVCSDVSQNMWYFYWRKHKTHIRFIVKRYIKRCSYRYCWNIYGVICVCVYVMYAEWFYEHFAFDEIL